MSSSRTGQIPKSWRLPDPQNPTNPPDATQSQSQTVDFNLHDSDTEEFSAARGLPDDVEDEHLRRVKDAKKGKMPANRRRFTVDFNDQDDAVLYRVSGADDDEIEQIAVAVGQAGFAEEVGSAAGEWYEGLQDAVKNARVTIRDFATQLKTLTEENNVLRSSADSTKEKYASLKLKLREMQGKLAASEADATRIRQLRDRYRESARILEDQNKILKKDLEEAKRGQPVHLYDSDDEAQTGQDQTWIRPNRTLTGVQDAVAPGHNKNYPDASTFDGNRAKWEQWKYHIQSKFKQSAFWFPTEEYKIDYIRDKCTFQAFTVIQPRMSPMSNDPYTNHQQVLDDLEENFGTHDKKAQAEADMQSPNFPMRSKDKNESFDTFHTRFAAAIAPLGYSEDHKIRDLRRYISPDLRSQVTNGVKPSSYRDFIVRLRTCDLEMRQNSAFEAQAKALQGGRATPGGRGDGGRGGRGDNSRSRGRGRGGRGGGPSTPFTMDQSTWPPHVLTQIQKKRLCLKCLKPGHWAREDDAPCKKAKALTMEEAESRLSAVGIEFAELEARTNNTGNESEN